MDDVDRGEVQIQVFYPLTYVALGSNW